MIKFFIYAFVFWLLYKFIFDFIVPVYQSTKQVRKQMSDIQENMRRQYKQQEQAEQAPQQPQPSVKKTDKRDYLDFEEIK